MIVTNSLMMGLAIFELVRSCPIMNAVFEQANQALLVSFTVELLLQFRYLGTNLFLVWLASL